MGIAVPLLTKPSRAKAWFDFLSRFYDFITPYFYNREMRATLVKEIEGERILDVGVGTGYSSKNFEKAVGVDISEKMLRKAKDYKGSLVLANGLNPPFKDESFDTIISAGSLYYFPDVRKALKVFHNLLVPKGVLLTLTPSWKILKFFVHVLDEKDLVYNFENTAFRVVKIEKMRNIAYFCKVRKT